MATGYTEATTIRIDFVDDTWLNAFPRIYSFVNTSSRPWKVDTTFQYNAQPTLRSGAIRDRGSTTITLNFTLVGAGSITFPYCVSSETNYDWLTVNIDNVQRVHASGSYDWTIYTQQLDAGEHTVTFTYSKDVTGTEGEDAAGIGYIELVGVRPNYNTYYLVHGLDTGKYYANVEGSLTEVTIQEIPTLQDFINYGGIVPTTGMLEQLTHFELLKCAETTERTELIPGIKYSIVGSAKPELFKCTKVISITEQYQTGFKSVSVELTKLDSTILKVLLSYDNSTWYRYNAASEEGSVASWSEVNFTTEDALANGMSLDELALVDTDAFSMLYTEDVPKTLYIAFVVQCVELDTWTIKGLRIEFTTNK